MKNSVESTDVNNAVDHLHEIGIQFCILLCNVCVAFVLNVHVAHFCKSSGSRADLIDEVVTILKDMVHTPRDLTYILQLLIQDARRLAAHEALEAETIACSMLRHQVAVFPDILKAEVAGNTLL